MSCNASLKISSVSKKNHTTTEDFCRVILGTSATRRDTCVNIKPAEGFSPKLGRSRCTCARASVVVACKHNWKGKLTPQFG